MQIREQKNSPYDLTPPKESMPEAIQTRLYTVAFPPQLISSSFRKAFLKHDSAI
jgi:hypothetical protein